MSWIEAQISASECDIRPHVIAQSRMLLREYNRKACIACNFNCLIGTEELLKATDNQVHSKSGNILETGDAVTVAL